MADLVNYIEAKESVNASEIGATGETRRRTDEAKISISSRSLVKRLCACAILLLPTQAIERTPNGR